MQCSKLSTLFHVIFLFFQKKKLICFSLPLLHLEEEILGCQIGIFNSPFPLHLFSLSILLALFLHPSIPSIHPIHFTPLCLSSHAPSCIPLPLSSRPTRSATHPTLHPHSSHPDQRAAQHTPRCIPTPLIPTDTQRKRRSAIAGHSYVQSARHPNQYG